MIIWMLRRSFINAVNKERYSVPRIWRKATMSSRWESDDSGGISLSIQMTIAGISVSNGWTSGGWALRYERLESLTWAIINSMCWLRLPALVIAGTTPTKGAWPRSAIIPCHITWGRGDVFRNLKMIGKQAGRLGWTVDWYACNKKDSHHRTFLLGFERFHAPDRFERCRMGRRQWGDSRNIGVSACGPPHKISFATFMRCFMLIRGEMSGAIRSSHHRVDFCQFWYHQKFPL